MRESSKVEIELKIAEVQTGRERERERDAMVVPEGVMICPTDVGASTQW